MKRTFPESELIINADGSCFHLHLKPEQLADKVVLVGDPARVDTVAAHFDSKECEVSSREFHTITGMYKGKRITCQSHGIGCDNIDIVVNELDTLANIDYKTREEFPEHRTLTMVRIGTCGGLQPNTPTGCFVASVKSIGFDGLLNYYAGRNQVCDLQLEEAFTKHMAWDPIKGAPYVSVADADLINQIAQDDMVRGYTISCGGFYGPQGRVLRADIADPKQNEKIEACLIVGPPCNDLLYGHRQPLCPEDEHRIQELHRYPHRKSPRPHLMTDTICALATAPGGALGIIRISGPQSLEILSHIFTRNLTQAQPNTIHYGHIKDGSEIIDEVLVSIFRAPHSYTGEDSAEISCHGSRYILNKVLELLIQNGCRMAQPGEYTQRAFLNGKMDLSQAEAVADLIASGNKATHQIAMSQLRGNFSSELSRLREQLLKLTSLLELELDFSDHEDLEFADRSELTNIANKINKRITYLAHSFETGQALKNGIPVAIVGKTNVGKSTLLNKLLRDDRAIVSSVHGTTRDTVEDVIDIQGVSFRFIDTAGIRQTTDEVEQIGISRTYAAIDKARIVLWLIDAEPTAEEIKDMLERSKGKSLIIIQNKIDIQTPVDSSIFHLASLLVPSNKPQSSILQISAKQGTNIDRLEKTIFESANIPEFTEQDIIVTSARQYHSLLSAQENLSRVLSSLESGLSEDLVSEDLRLVLDDLANITGQNRILADEVLRNIFTHFCVGK